MKIVNGINTEVATIPEHPRELNTARITAACDEFFRRRGLRVKSGPLANKLNFRKQMGGEPAHEQKQATPNGQGRAEVPK